MDDKNEEYTSTEWMEKKLHTPKPRIQKQAEAHHWSAAEVSRLFNVRVVQHFSVLQENNVSAKR
jgi:hypothetical protein